MSARHSAVTSLRKGSVWVKPALITVVLLYMFFLVFVPFFVIFREAFGEGFRAFASVLARPDVLHALALTLWLSLGTVAVNTVFGLIVAWVLVRHEFPGRSVLNALVDMPFAVSPVVAGYMLILLFGRAGWFSGLVRSAGISVLFSWPGMLLATVFVSLPFVIREVMPVLQEMGREQEEAALTLGATAWQRFWRVIFPGIRWGLFYGVTLTLARALGEFGAVFVVSGAVSGETETATLFVFRAMDERMQHAACVVSVVLGSLCIAVLMVMELVKKRMREV